MQHTYCFTWLDLKSSSIIDPIGFSPSLPHCWAHSWPSWCTALDWYHHTIHTGSPPKHLTGQSMLRVACPWDSWSQSLLKRGPWHKLPTWTDPTDLLSTLINTLTDCLTIFILVVNYCQISFLFSAQRASIGPVGFNVILLSSEHETFIVETQPTCTHKERKTKALCLKKGGIQATMSHKTYDVTFWRAADWAAFLTADMIDWSIWLLNT